jgi:hypothetical protein
MSTSPFKSEQLTVGDELAGRLVEIRVRDTNSDWIYRRATILRFPSIGPDPWVRFSNSQGEYLIPLRNIKAITWAREEEAS